MVYRYRTGHGFKGVDAGTVGETIAALTEANGGQITPAAVVEASAPEDAPLHPVFEWDDSEAAILYREDQARRVIRSYVVVTADAEGNEREELANVSVANPYDANGPAYMPTTNAMDNPELRARIIAMARGQLDAWQARYGHLEELATAADLVRQAREAAARKPVPAPRRRQPNRRRQPATAMA